MRFRNIENEIVAWWLNNYPQCKNVLLDEVNCWGKDEEIGLYNLFRDLLNTFYINQMKSQNDLKIFLKVYNDFLVEFLPKYQQGKGNKLEDMTCIELFEDLYEEEERNIIENCLPEGVLKTIYFNYKKERDDWQ